MSTSGSCPASGLSPRDLVLRLREKGMSRRRSRASSASAEWGSGRPSAPTRSCVSRGCSALGIPRSSLTFMRDMAGRLANRMEVTTDRHRPYLEAVEDAFGSEIDYAVLQKLYGSEPQAEPCATGPRSASEPTPPPSPALHGLQSCSRSWQPQDDAHRQSRNRPPTLEGRGRGSPHRLENLKPGRPGTAGAFVFPRAF